MTRIAKTLTSMRSASASCAADMRRLRLVSMPETFTGTKRIKSVPATTASDSLQSTSISSTPNTKRAPTLATPFEVGEAKFALEFLIVAFDAPAQFGGIDENFDRSILGQ